VSVAVCSSLLSLHSDTIRHEKTRSSGILPLKHDSALSAVAPPPPCPSSFSICPEAPRLAQPVASGLPRLLFSIRTVWGRGSSKSFLQKKGNLPRLRILGAGVEVSYHIEIPSDELPAAREFLASFENESTTITT
jgi:hypothetical protein